MTQKAILWTVGSLFCLSLVMIGFLGVQFAPHGTTASIKLRTAEVYGHLPMAFEQNEGQAEAPVKFLSRGGGYTVSLTPGELIVQLRREERKAIVKNAASESRTSAQLRMKFSGANPSAQISGVGRLTGKSNYFIGNDPAKWHRNISTYAQVRYQDMYPGIDLVYHGDHGQLEYDFVVAPGADPKSIRLAFPSTESLRVDAGGDLVLHTQGADLRLRKPVVYQLEERSAFTRNAITVGPRAPRPTTKHFVEGRYVLRHSKQKSRNSKAGILDSNIEVSFEIAAFDTAHALVIDPVLVYSTYLGGSATDFGYGIAADSTGNAYVTGFSGGDVFVAKLDRAGSRLLYSTTLGGSSDDFGLGIAVDSAGNAYITGETFSTNFPTVNPLQTNNGGGADAFVAKLDATGSNLLYSTYLGGSGADSGSGIAVDSGGNAYVTGSTSSSNFPTANPVQPANGGGTDAFVASLNSSGSTLLYSTYLGGANQDSGSGIGVDSQGNAYVTGSTSSTNFPTANPLQPANGGGTDGFVASLDSTGATLMYSTYLGGSGDDAGLGIAVDSIGTVYVTGSTGSTNFPTANPVQPANRGGANDAFIAHLDSSGATLLYSTYLGGSGDDRGRSIAVNGDGKAYVTGDTDSTNFPIVFPVRPVYFGGAHDAFVANLDTDGATLLSSTYFGGNGDDSGRGIAVDGDSKAYVTGGTGSTNFPLANPLQPTYGGGAYDAFVAKMAPIQLPPDITTKYVVPVSKVGDHLGCCLFEPDGALWFDQANDQGFPFTGNLGRISASGVVTKYPTQPNVTPGRLTFGPDGAVWFTEFDSSLPGNHGRIGRITTAGIITEFVVPGDDGLPVDITTGPDGALWFAQLYGNRIGRMTTAGVMTEFPLPTPDSGPSSITTGPDGALWFTENLNGNGIGRITTAGVITEYPLPDPQSRPEGITPGPDGALWFTASSPSLFGGVNKIGRITTAGVITEYDTPTQNSAPFGIAAGPDGALWFMEALGNNLGQLTADGTIVEYTLPPGRFGEITVGPDRALWFRDPAPNTIDHAVLCACP